MPQIEYQSDGTGLVSHASFLYKTLHAAGNRTASDCRFSAHKTLITSETQQIHKANALSCLAIRPVIANRCKINKQNNLL